MRYHFLLYPNDFRAKGCQDCFKLQCDNCTVGHRELGFPAVVKEHWAFSFHNYHSFNQAMSQMRNEVVYTFVVTDQKSYHTKTQPGKLLQVTDRVANS